MKHKSICSLLLLATVILSHGAAVLRPGDAIFAINPNGAAPASSFPLGQPPERAIDGIGDQAGNKYLNFGGSGSGFITTPTTAAAVQSFTISTGGDEPGRDPARYAIYGTNEPIASAQNSNGTGESWVLISQGALSLPAGRNVVGDVVSFANPTAYSSYKVVFPTVKGAPIMQISELTSFSTLDGTGPRVFETGNPILAIDTPSPSSSTPLTQGPEMLLDSDSTTKYLNFGKAGSGFIVTPQDGSSIVKSFSLTSAGDAASFIGRNPASYEIYGTNESIVSFQNGFGTEESWSLITEGELDASQMPTTNETTGVPVNFANESAYTSYKVLFPTLNGTNNPNSMQLANFQFDTVPEPSVALLGSLAVLGLMRRRR